MGRSDLERAAKGPVVVIISRQRLYAESLAFNLCRDPAWIVHSLPFEAATRAGTLERLDPTAVVLAFDDEVFVPVREIGRFVERAPRARFVAIAPPPPATFRQPVSVEWLDADASLEVVQRAVERAAAGIPSKRRSGLERRRSAAETSAVVLSQRETDVLARLARGQSTVTIASDLGIAQGTVRKHVQHILQKFNVHSKLEAAAAAKRLGIQ